MFAVNIRGYFYCARACIPHMVANQSTSAQGHCCGKIVHIASITAWGILPNLLDYVSTEGAVISFTRALKRRGTLEGLANAVLLLISPRSDFITGQTLVVDGGWVMA